MINPPDRVAEIMELATVARDASREASIALTMAKYGSELTPEDHAAIKLSFESDRKLEAELRTLVTRGATSHDANPTEVKSLGREVVMAGISDLIDLDYQAIARVSFLATFGHHPGAEDFWERFIAKAENHPVDDRGNRAVIAEVLRQLAALGYRLAGPDEAVVPTGFLAQVKGVRDLCAIYDFNDPLARVDAGWVKVNLDVALNAPGDGGTDKEVPSILAEIAAMGWTARYSDYDAFAATRRFSAWRGGPEDRPSPPAIMPAPPREHVFSLSDPDLVSGLRSVRDEIKRREASR